MAGRQVRFVHEVLESQSVVFCFVGEVALNYYNVPRVIHVGASHPNRLALCLILKGHRDMCFKTRPSQSQGHL